MEKRKIKRKEKKIFIFRDYFVLICYAYSYVLYACLFNSFFTGERKWTFCPKKKKKKKKKGKSEISY